MEFEAEFEAYMADLAEAFDALVAEVEVEDVEDGPFEVEEDVEARLEARRWSRLADFDARAYGGAS